MKKFVVIILLHFLGFHALQAGDNTHPKQKRHAQTTWQAQVISYLYYPEVLRKANWEGTVPVSFQVDSQQRVSQVQVETGNPKANANLIHQLVGKQLAGTNLQPEHTYTMQVKFLLVD